MKIQSPLGQFMSQSIGQISKQFTLGFATLVLVFGTMFSFSFGSINTQALIYNQYCPNSFFDSNCNNADYINDSIGCLFHNDRCSSGALKNPRFDLFSPTTYSGIIDNPYYAYDNRIIDKNNDCADSFFLNLRCEPSELDAYKNSQVANCYSYFSQVCGDNSYKASNNCNRADVVRSVGEDIKNVVKGDLDISLYNRVKSCYDKGLTGTIPATIATSSYNQSFNNNCPVTRVTQNLKSFSSNSNIGRLVADVDCNGGLYVRSQTSILDSNYVNASSNCYNNSENIRKCNITTNYSINNGSSSNYGYYGSYYSTDNYTTCFVVIPGSSSLEGCKYNSDGSLYIGSSYGYFGGFGGGSGNYTGFGTLGGIYDNNYGGTYYDNGSSNYLDILPTYPTFQNNTNFDWNNV